MWLNDVLLFKSWLYKVLWWEIIDWYRVLCKEVLLDENIFEKIIELVFSEFFLFLRYLFILLVKEWDVVELFYFNDLNIKEISLVVGILLGMVKLWLYCVCILLKKCILDME